jgi:hypothetical protein
MEKILSLTLKPDSLKTLSRFFQQGVLIKTLVGGSIQDLLIRDLGLTPEYLETRIQTIFLNGKAVDDPARAIVRDGATLALSGAMPGLVGATFRRGGTYASLRQAITLTATEEPVSEREGQVILKLFNLLVPEIGPLVLAKGFWITGKELDTFVENYPGNFWAPWAPVQVAGKDVDVQALGKTIWSPNKEETVLIKITLRPNPSL